MEEISNVDVLLWQCNQWIFIFYENRIFCSLISTLLTNCFENKSLYFFLSQILLIWIELLTPIKNKSKLKLFGNALVLTIDWNLWIKFTVKNIPSVTHWQWAIRSRHADEWPHFTWFIRYICCASIYRCVVCFAHSKWNSYKHST